MNVTPLMTVSDTTYDYIIHLEDEHGVPQTHFNCGTNEEGNNFLVIYL